MNTGEDMADGTGTEQPIYAVTFKDVWAGVPTAQPDAGILERHGIAAGTHFGSEAEARQFAALLAAQHGRPLALFRVVRFAATDVLEC